MTRGLRVGGSRFGKVCSSLAVVACASSPDEGGAGGAGHEEEPPAELWGGATYFPEDLAVGALGTEGSLFLEASTFLAAGDEFEFLAAVKNTGSATACSPGILVNLRDSMGSLLGTAGGSILTNRSCLVSTEPATWVPCLDPGEVGLATVAGALEADALSRLDGLEFSLPAFVLRGVETLEGLAVTTSSDRNSVEVVLENRTTDVFLRDPRLVLFSLTDEGRPAQALALDAPVALAPGEEFRTTISRGRGRPLAYFSGSLERSRP